MLYKGVELASSFSDLQKLTYFGCASWLRVCLERASLPSVRSEFLQKHEQSTSKCVRGEYGVAAVLGQCAPSPCAGAMHAIDLGMPPQTFPRQGRRRPMPRFRAAGANGTDMRQCWSARRKATAIDKNSSKVRHREDSLATHCTDKPG